MGEYTYSGRFDSLTALAALSVLSDPFEDLLMIRQAISRPKRKLVRRSRIVRPTKTTHRRNRATVAAGRKANVQRLAALYRKGSNR